MANAIAWSALAAVMIAGAAFEAWWGTTVLSNIWGYRDSTVQTYLSFAAVQYAVAAVLLAGAILSLKRLADGWLILATMSALAAVVPYWLWIDLGVPYVCNLGWAVLAVTALSVHHVRHAGQMTKGGH